MTAYEKCKLVRTAILNRAAEVMNYTNWSDEFAAKQIRGVVESLSKRIGAIKIEELSKDEMEDIGFGVWSSENQMRLIPLWLFQFLPDRIECESINGEKTTLLKSAMDNDNRFGFLAYGIVPRKVEG